MFIFSVSVLLTVYLSVLLHEFGHGIAAVRNGLTVEKIQLWFLGGVAVMDDIPQFPQTEFRVTVAGPIITAILAPLFLSLSGLFYVTGNLTLYWFFLVVGLFNTGMLLLNLTPILPLDGGRMLRSTLNRTTTYANSTLFVHSITLVITLAVAGVSIYYHQFGITIIAGLLLFMSSAHKDAALEEHGKNTDTSYTLSDVDVDSQKFQIQEEDLCRSDKIPPGEQTSKISLRNDTSIHRQTGD